MLIVDLPGEEKKLGNWKLTLKEEKHLSCLSFITFVLRYKTVSCSSRSQPRIWVAFVVREGTKQTETSKVRRKMGKLRKVSRTLTLMATADGGVSLCQMFQRKRTPREMKRNSCLLRCTTTMREQPKISVLKRENTLR